MILTAKQLLSNLPNKQSIKGYMFRLIQGLLSNQQCLAALAVCQCAPSEGTALKGRGGGGGSLPISLGSWAYGRTLVALGKLCRATGGISSRRLKSILRGCIWWEAPQMLGGLRTLSWLFQLHEGELIQFHITPGIVVCFSCKSHEDYLFAAEYSQENAFATLCIAYEYF